MPTPPYDLPELLKQLAEQLTIYLQEHQINNPVLVGIERSGVWLAAVLHERLQLTEALGSLNISFYRDDYHRTGLAVQTEPSRLPLSLEDRHIILVDDIIHTGRTIRAAMNELFDYGRPASIILATIVARQGRELPIEPQVCVLREDPGKDYIYHISQDPLRMELVRKT
ncbi:bifunctional pyr operon transcriptional regulator/uracil phosphoribosyltransferase PyrR [Thiothrix eikelboomii]|uniref:Pyrimidine operon attenuation protein / uracil phosphoribosyltransferase n=1 Tax=Thiothrix eikelboomii TaxID=92487 RepID=A0A1T4XGR1_9GAMM|nr:bifunctional pyr operon transcriptional regulator/uracil phosphoribosyltransferase PyrR [Thiothrix eikelboomii]SKA88683.1 pyrimidine operon attenuation protein / uracil phosphoribosyltransferase [Thiothrix eikelboomii]